MPHFRSAALLAISLTMAARAASPPPLVCPAGTPIGNVDLRVRRADGGEALPLKTINRLEEGDTIIYQPLVRSTEVRKGEVAIVLVPAVHPSDEENLTVLEPKPAGKVEEWSVPSKSSVAAFVYGPTGLSRGKVKKFLSKDDELVAQLADYAEKTAQTEALIAALSSDANSGASMNAAINGFASQSGAAQIDRTQPQDQQMLLALRTMNPAVASYDPITPQSSQVIGQTASLATSVAALFFGSPVGLAAGGTAMLVQMHSLAFPNTVFRSSFAQPMPEDGLGLCGKRDAVPPHTRVAYLWATRVPNIGPPHVLVEKMASVAIGMKMAVPIGVAPESAANYLSRARKWSLDGERESVEIPVHEVALPETSSHENAELKALELDLSKARLRPGDYTLKAHWDWDKFAVAGEVHVVALSDFKKAHLAAQSQDRLLTKAGRVPLSVEGSDFEFVAKVELEKPGDQFFTAMPVPFVLPHGFRQGDQERMDIQINTSDLDPGDYRMVMFQADGKPHAVPLAILPIPPAIENLPVLVNQGDPIREVTLKGKGLNRVARLEAANVKIFLEPASADGFERKIRVQFEHDPRAGTKVDFKEYVENRSEPIVLTRAVEVIGPRPRIMGSRLSLPNGVGVALNPGELPASYVLSAMLHVADLNGSSSLTLGCRGDDQTRETLKPGMKSALGSVTGSASGSMERLGADQVFVTFDDGVFPDGCELLAATENGAGTGGSDPYALGRVVRVPKIDLVAIDSLPLQDPVAAGAGFEATLQGSDLETIDRAGWDPEHGVPVADLPSAVSGDALKQELRITLPSGPPSPDGTLYVWLRGESAGRASLVRPVVKGKQKTAMAAGVDRDHALH